MGSSRGSRRECKRCKERAPRATYSSHLSICLYLYPCFKNYYFSLFGICLSACAAQVKIDLMIRLNDGDLFKPALTLVDSAPNTGFFDFEAAEIDLPPFLLNSTSYVVVIVDSDNDQRYGTSNNLSVGICGLGQTGDIDGSGAMNVSAAEALTNVAQVLSAYARGVLIYVCVWFFPSFLPSFLPPFRSSTLSLSCKSSSTSPRLRLTPAAPLPRLSTETTMRPSTLWTQSSGCRRF